MLIHRNIQPILQEIAHQFPVIGLLGPRQSGKTTLAKETFPHHTYISLEDLDVRARAQEDPRTFLASYANPQGLILDEIQHVPTLLSYIQTQVDQTRVPGYFILTGSQNILVSEAVSQTLAGRIAVFTLLPLSISELNADGLLPLSIEDLIFRGSYPGLYAYQIDRHIWYASYTLTYLERNLRQVIMVKDLTTFHRFLKLCAARIGQLLNVSSLATDCGIKLKTAQEWLSILQASYIIFLLSPHYKNFNKRLVKTHKLYFYDTGLACSLLGIETADQLQNHYLRGGLVESLVISNFYKATYNCGELPSIYFWRDNHGHEVDCLIERGERLIPIEIKAGKTVTTDYFSGITYWLSLAGTDPNDAYVVYTGLENQKSKQGQAVSWKDAEGIVSKDLLTL